MADGDRIMSPQIFGWSRHEAAMSLAVG